MCRLTSSPLHELLTILFFQSSTSISLHLAKSTISSMPLLRTARSVSMYVPNHGSCFKSIESYVSTKAFDHSGETSTPRISGSQSFQTSFLLANIYHSIDTRRSPRKMEKRPVYVLNITLPKTTVDICLEPSKTSVQIEVFASPKTLLIQG